MGIVSRAVHRCPECDLPDYGSGAGDGIGSCDCPHCRDCGQVDAWCTCPPDDYPWGNEGEDEP